MESELWEWAEPVGAGAPSAAFQDTIHGVLLMQNSMQTVEIQFGFRRVLTKDFQLYIIRIPSSWTGGPV